MRRLLRCATGGLLVVLHLWGCGDDGGTPFGNQAPTVWLSGAPPEGSISRYTVHLYWGGWDPDGEIQFYEYIITNNETGVFDPADTMSTPGDYKWRPVFRNDSTFTCSADLIPDSSVIDFGIGNPRGGTHAPEEFRRSHTFFIRAVDEEGMRSIKPAHRSFTARTLSPTVVIEVPPATGLNAALVPPITTFRWKAFDYVAEEGEVQLADSVRHILVAVDPPPYNGDWNVALAHIRDPHAPEWSEWQYYSAPDDSGKFWTSPHLDFGYYYFAVQAMDEAGAVSPVFDLDENLRRILVGPRGDGPKLTVTNQYIGTVVASGTGGSPTVIDLPAGVAMSFELEATAEDYGGIVSGYRYGWDILDLDDPDQWEIDFTPFIGNEARAKVPPRTFYFASHSCFIEVIDNSGFKSRVEVRMNVVPFTMENDLLLVDDWIEGEKDFLKNKGVSPSEAEHDAFWNDMLASVAGFNPNTDVFKLRKAGKNELPIHVMARYKNIIWYASGNSTGDTGAFLDDVITYKDPNAEVAAKTPPNLVSLYMAAGGHVLLAGNQVMALVVNTNTLKIPLYPLIFRYELGGDQDGAYKEQGVNEVGKIGVGEKSFAYLDCCLNVLDVTYLQNSIQIRHGVAPTQNCPVDDIRDSDRVKDGLRTALPLDVTTGPGFPQLDLRPEVASPGKFFQSVGLIADIYNPYYFGKPGADCAGVAETNPPRNCFQKIYGNGCSNTSSVIYNEAVAFWTSQYADRVADVAGAVPARSAIFGFHPVYFRPEQVRDAIGIIVHDEWKLESQ